MLLLLLRTDSSARLLLFYTTVMAAAAASSCPLLPTPSCALSACRHYQWRFCCYFMFTLAVEDMLTNTPIHSDETLFMAKAKSILRT